MIVPTTDSNFARDTSTNAILNTNTMAYRQYKEQRDRAKREDVLSQEVTALSSQVQTLGSELDQIKQLLLKLVQNDSINR